jgi:hypothetical protein
VSNSNVVKLVQPGTFSDQLTEVLRRGARCLLAQAVEAEVADFLGGHGELKTGGWSPTRRPPRPSARAGGADGDWPCRASPATGA